MAVVAQYEEHGTVYCGNSIQSKAKILTVLESSIKTTEHID